jgi:endonuclease/exonuclease/phosphatase family metal-dependent hydrolase
MSIIIEKKTLKTMREEVKVISWNMDKKNKNIGQKINQILERNADIIMLQECISGTGDIFSDYVSYDTATGHHGIIKLLIHNRLNPELINVFKDNGILIYHLNTFFGNIIVASIHLPPFNQINDKILRTITIYKIINFLKKENLTKLPIIIGGDTNMQEDEHIGNLSEDILEDLYDNFGDDNNYHVWPAKKTILNKKQKLRSDRFFYSNLSVKNFNTWITENSDHPLIETDIFFNKISLDSINTKLEKIKIHESKLKNKNNLFLSFL